MNWYIILFCVLIHESCAVNIKKNLYVSLGLLTLIEYSVVVFALIFGVMGSRDQPPPWSPQLLLHLLFMIILLVSIMTLVLLSLSVLHGNIKSEFGIGANRQSKSVSRIRKQIKFYILLLYYFASIFSIISIFGSFYEIFGLSSGENCEVKSDVGTAIYSENCFVKPDIGSAIYFSAVTWFTVGYGDLTPAPGPARVVAVCEIFCGVLFTAILTAGAVNLLGVFRPPYLQGTDEETKQAGRNRLL